MGTWIVGTAIVVIVALAVRKVYRDRKNGKGCGCGCDGCSNCPEFDGEISREGGSK